MIEWLPTWRPEVVNVPLLWVRADSCQHVRTVGECDASRGCPEPDTVAVQVRDCPRAEGFADELTAVVVAP